MGKFINENPIEHVGQHGTRFNAERADLRGGVTVAEMPEDRLLMAADFAGFGAWHAYAIHPNLNGFAGYDSVKYRFFENNNAKNGER